MSLATTMPHEENGIIVNFPDMNYFQFESCPAYTAISGQKVREMDFGWYESVADTLWLVELKGFFHPVNTLHQPTDLSSAQTVEGKLSELYEKSLHSLCMISSNRNGTAGCFRSNFSNTSTLKLVHILSVMPGQETYLQPMSDKLNNLLKPVKSIFRVNEIAIVPHSLARGLFAWIN